MAGGTKHLTVQLLGYTYTTSEDATYHPSLKTCKVATQVMDTMTQIANLPTPKRCDELNSWASGIRPLRFPNASAPAGGGAQLVTNHPTCLGGPCKESPRAPLGVGISPLGVFLSPSGSRRSVEFLVAALRLGGREPPRYPPHLVGIRYRAMVFLCACCGLPYIW